MSTFRDLAKTEHNEHWRRVFSTIAQREVSNGATNDGAEPIVLDCGEIEQIRDAMSDNVMAELTKDGDVQTATQFKQTMRLDTKNKLDRYVADAKARIENLQKITQDGYYNPVSGIGTFIDPGMSTQASIPVVITPTEATAYYTSGGLPTRIIDKKAGCMTLNGVPFECAAFTPDDLTKLSEYSDKCGFTESYRHSVNHALVFGGAVDYPVLKGETPIMSNMTTKQLLDAIPYEKDFINYWVTADRWNVVFVPDYTITAKDYLKARTIFLPIGGVRINTDRVAMIKPRKLPFWGAIKQMGWSTSEFEGWIKDYESYEIMKMSLPIMAQQMSLMYHSFPADGLIIENGPDYAKQFFKQNEKEMREWSMLNPKAINSVGEIKILERTYTGFQQLISESELALCASSGIAKSVLFADKSTGLASDNRDDIELKQSETIRLLFNNIAPSFRPCIDMLVYSCFGKNSEQAKHAHEVTIKADSGVVLNDSDKAQLGTSFAQIISALVASGTPLKSAIDIAHKFVPTAELTDEIMAEIGAGESQNIDSGLWEMLNANRGL